MISALDLNNLLKRLNTSTQFSYTKFELIIKLVAEQSFNPLAPISERIKMFMIHIRNYVKMHYQISLSINPIKKLLLGTQEISSGNKSASPARQNNYSYKSLSRKNSKFQINEGGIQHNLIPPAEKISYRKGSPTVQLIVTQKVDNLRSSNNRQSCEITNDIRTHQRSNTTATSSKDLKQAFQEIFQNFKDKHQGIIKKPKNREKLIEKHDNYIGNLRSSLFTTRFIKSLIFNAWKSVIKAKFEA